MVCYFPWDFKGLLFTLSLTSLSQAPLMASISIWKHVLSSVLLYLLLCYTRKKTKYEENKQTWVCSLGANNAAELFGGNSWKNWNLFNLQTSSIHMTIKHNFDYQVKEYYAHTFRVLYMPFIFTKSNRLSNSDMIYLFKADLGSHAGWQQSFFPQQVIIFYVKLALPQRKNNSLQSKIKTHGIVLIDGKKK